MISSNLLLSMLPLMALSAAFCDRDGSIRTGATSTPIPEWEHLSSTEGDLPAPGPSDQQTASLVLDIDQDGWNDLVVAARKEAPAVLWFRRSADGWEKYPIDTAYLRVEAGGAVHDIDGDGDPDILFGADAGDHRVWWWENPYPDFSREASWPRHPVKVDGANKHHDQAFGDVDGDGQTELVFWNQRGKNLVVADIPEKPRQAESWPQEVIYTYEGDTQHEGLALADIDGDGITDIVGGGRWFKHQEDGTFQPILIDDEMRFTRAAAGQLRAGGHPEIVFVPGDADGPLRIYEATGDPTDPSAWEVHEPLDGIVYHGHSLALADINDDGHLDIFNAEMHTPGQGEEAVARILYGDGELNFELFELSTGIGNHESKVADLDGDGDLDIFTKPYTWDAPRIDVWLNEGEGGRPENQSTN